MVESGYVGTSHVMGSVQISNPFGFDFFEPIATRTYGSPSDDVWTFMGIASDTPFTSAQMRETVGGIDDEFWGQFHTGGPASSGKPPESVTEPASIVLLAAGLISAFALRRRARA